MSDRIYGFDIPHQLLDVAARHERHIAKLIVQFRSIGMTDATIEQSVDQLIASYRAELIKAIKMLREACND